MSPLLGAVTAHIREQAAAYCQSADEEQERIFTGFAGGPVQAPTRRFAPVRKDLFAPAGVPLAAFNGYSRLLLVSYHGDRDGRPGYRCAGGRMTRREQK